MGRPKIKDYFAEKADVKTVHNEYINSPHLYSYASALDRYVDCLEDKLSKLENTTYELTYTDFLGRRQIQNAIKTKEEAFRRKKEFYNSKDCDAIVKEVVKTYENEECVDIEKTII